MSLPTVASVRSEVVAAREEATSDLERYLTLQRLVDALDRVYATLQRLEAAAAGCAGAEIAGAAAELEAAVSAASGALGPALQQRVAAVAPMLDDAASRVAPRTRAARRSVSAPAEVRRSIRGGMLGASEPATPLPNVSPALFGASAPSAVAPGARFAAHFVAYAEGAEASARALLAETQGDAHVVTEAGATACHGDGRRGRVVWCGHHRRRQPRDVQRFVWTGRTKVLGFEVEPQRRPHPPCCATTSWSTASCSPGSACRWKSASGRNLNRTAPRKLASRRAPSRRTVEGPRACGLTASPPSASPRRSRCSSIVTISTRARPGSRGWRRATAATPSCCSGPMPQPSRGGCSGNGRRALPQARLGQHAVPPAGERRQAAARAGCDPSRRPLHADLRAAERVRRATAGPTKEAA